MQSDPCFSVPSLFGRVRACVCAATVGGWDSAYAYNIQMTSALIQVEARVILCLKRRTHCQRPPLSLKSEPIPTALSSMQPTSQAANISRYHTLERSAEHTCGCDENAKRFMKSTQLSMALSLCCHSSQRAKAESTTHKKCAALSTLTGF